MTHSIEKPLSCESLNSSTKIITPMEQLSIDHKNSRLIAKTTLQHYEQMKQQLLSLTPMNTVYKTSMSNINQFVTPKQLHDLKETITTLFNKKKANLTDSMGMKILLEYFDYEYTPSDINKKALFPPMLRAHLSQSDGDECYNQLESSLGDIIEEYTKKSGNHKKLDPNFLKFVFLFRYIVLEALIDFLKETNADTRFVQELKIKYMQRALSEYEREKKHNFYSIQNLGLQVPNLKNERHALVITSAYDQHLDRENGKTTKYDYVKWLNFSTSLNRRERLKFFGKISVIGYLQALTYLSLPLIFACCSPAVLIVTSIITAVLFTIIGFHLYQAITGRFIAKTTTTEANVKHPSSKLISKNKKRLNELTHEASTLTAAIQLTEIQTTMVNILTEQDIRKNPSLISFKKEMEQNPEKLKQMKEKDPEQFSQTENTLKRLEKIEKTIASFNKNRDALKKIKRKLNTLSKKTPNADKSKHSEETLQKKINYYDVFFDIYFSIENHENIQNVSDAKNKKNNAFEHLARAFEHLNQLDTLFTPSSSNHRLDLIICVQVLDYLQLTPMFTQQNATDNDDVSPECNKKIIRWLDRSIDVCLSIKKQTALGEEVDKLLNFISIYSEINVEKIDSENAADIKKAIRTTLHPLSSIQSLDQTKRTAAASGAMIQNLPNKTKQETEIPNHQRQYQPENSHVFFSAGHTNKVTKRSACPSVKNERAITSISSHAAARTRAAT